MTKKRKKLTIEQSEKLRKYPTTLYAKKEEQSTFKRKIQHKAGYVSEKLPLADSCEFCGSLENLGRHHPDYRYPEIYVTCCAECHKRAQKDQEPTVSYIRFIKSDSS